MYVTPGQGQDAHAVQAEQPARDRTGHRVEQDIHPCRRQVAAQAARELSDGELQPEGEQQQHHADRRAGADELRAAGIGAMPPSPRASPAAR